MFNEKWVKQPVSGESMRRQNLVSGQGLLRQGSLPGAIVIVVVLLFGLVTTAFAQSQYNVQSGDVLAVSVWNEPDLTGDITVHPDGTFSMPLVGEVNARGRTLAEIQDDVTKGLSKYIPEAIVTIGLGETVGTRIYVIGQVNEPGVFRVDKPTDIMQALSLAGGMTAFASDNRIRILRRSNNNQEAISFRYGDVAKGDNLEQNIILQDGDVVVVP